MMSMIQRYLTIELIRVFVFVMVINTTLMTFIGVFQQANDLGLDTAFTMRLIPFILPTMLPFTIPAALLLSVTIVYGRFASDNEIVAVKAAGISPGVLLWPALFVGTSTTFATYLMMDHVIPWSAREIQKIVVNGMEEIVLRKLKVDNAFHQGSTNIFVTSVQNKVLIRPVIQYARGAQQFMLTAESALLKIDAEQAVLNLTLQNATIEGLGESEDKNRIVLQGYNHFKIQLPPLTRKRLGYHLTGDEVDAQLVNLEHSIEIERKTAVLKSFMGLTQARFEDVIASQQMSQTNKIQTQIWKLLTEKHGRYALAASCVVFVLVGSTLATIQAASHYLLSFLTCFLPTVCLYYPIVLGSISMCQSGNLDPRYAVWTGNGLSVFVLIFLVRKFYQR